MSHSVLFHRFDYGAPISLDPDHLKTVLGEFGLSLTEAADGWAFAEGSSVEEIGSELQFLFDESGVAEISIDRPTYSDLFHGFAAKMITTLNVSMMPSFGEIVYHPADFDAERHLPEGLAADLAPVRSAEDLHGPED